MPKIRSAISQSSVLTQGQPTSTVRQGSTNAGASYEAVSKGLTSVAQAMLVHQRVREDERKKSEAELASREVATNFVNLQADWSKRMLELEQNTPDNVLDVVESEYDEYVAKMMENVTTSKAAEELKLRSDQFRINVYENGHKLSVRDRAVKWASDFDNLMLTAQDSIYSSKDVGDLERFQQALTSFVKDGFESGRIRDETTLSTLLNKVEQLSYGWGLATVDDQPDLVIEALETDLFSGVSVQNRETLRIKAQRAMDSQDELDKVALRQAFSSDLAQRYSTGNGSSFNYEAAKQAFGKTTADQMQRQLIDASRLFHISEQLRGAGPEVLNEMFTKHQPMSDPSSTTYDADLDFHNKVQQLVIQANEDKRSDPFGWYAQDPTIKEMIRQAAENPEDTNLGYAIQETILDKQRQDRTLIPADYAIMPAEQAKQFIDDFNRLTAVGSEETGVRERLIDFSEQFKGNVHVALNQLNQNRAGSRVSAKLNPLMWHLDNPSAFNLILNAVRKDDTDANKALSPDVRRDLIEDVFLDNAYLQYQASVFSTNTSAEAAHIVYGTREVFQAFARDMAINGATVSNASEIFFGPYSFAELNGATYARPNTYTTADGRTHMVTPEMTKLSDEWLKVEMQQLSRKNTRNIDPVSILPMTENFTPEQLQEDLRDQLRNNGFWATTEDESGVYLYVKGAYPGTAVKAKDVNGDPIKIAFQDTYTGRHRVNRRGDPETRRTDDTWRDDLRRTLRALSD